MSKSCEDLLFDVIEDNNYFKLIDLVEEGCIDLKNSEYLILEFAYENSFINGFIYLYSQGCKLGNEGMFNSDIDYLFFQCVDAWGFKEEIIIFLIKQGVDFDEDYIDQFCSQKELEIMKKARNSLNIKE